MYLHSLKLKNFRGFRGVSQEIIFKGPNGQPGSGLNILVGENNAGKSTILSAICFLRDDTFQKKDPSSVAPQGNDNHSSGDRNYAGVIGEFTETSPDIMLRNIEAFMHPEFLSTALELLTSNAHVRCRRLWHEDSHHRNSTFLLDYE